MQSTAVAVLCSCSAEFVRRPWGAGLTAHGCLPCASGSDSDEDGEQDHGEDDEEDEDGEPLLAIEKRARILDKKRCYLNSSCVSCSHTLEICCQSLGFRLQKLGGRWGSAD